MKMYSYPLYTLMGVTVMFSMEGTKFWFMDKKLGNFLVLLALSIDIPLSYYFHKEVAECEPSIHNRGTVKFMLDTHRQNVTKRRFYIASEKSMKPILSPQYILNIFLQHG